MSSPVSVGAAVPVRAALLAAAHDAVVGGGWSRTRMADVASAAGVSRQTLYNEFGSKDALVAALAEERTAELLHGVDLRLDAATAGPLDALRDALAWLLDRAHEDPLVKAVLVSGHDGEVLLPFITTRAEPIIAQGSAHFVAFLSGHWPALPPERATALAESLIRLVVSHIVVTTAPTTATAQTLAGLAAAVLGGPDA